MRRSLLLPVCCLVAVLGSALPAQAGAAEDGVYVYNLFREASNCLELFGRLRRLALRPTVILSIEEGPEFILDRPEGEQQLACVLRFLRGSDRRVKAMFLQDTGFLRDSREAVRRAALLGEFAARYPGELAGVHVDVEPHADTTWENSDTTERRGLLEGLHSLLRQVRPRLHGLPLGAAIPWWYADVVEEFPEAAPQALFQAADELHFMLYGDDREPNPLDVARLFDWIGDEPDFSESGRVYVVLATYQFPTKARLETGLRQIRRLLGSNRNFAGTTVFHAESGYRSSRGAVSGPAAGAR